MGTTAFRGLQALHIRSRLVPLLPSGTTAQGHLNRKLVNTSQNLWKFHSLCKLEAPSPQQGYVADH